MPPSTPSLCEKYDLYNLLYFILSFVNIFLNTNVNKRQNIFGGLMKGFKEFLTYFLFGSTLYGLIEIAYRNHTHWTMVLAGGIVLYGVSVISKAYEKRSIFFKCFLGASLVTAIELFAGIVINRIFRLNVWDYSNMPLNILGQICPSFSFLWFLICIPANYFCNSIKTYIK